MDAPLAVCSGLGWATALVWAWRAVFHTLSYRRAPRVPGRPARDGAPMATILVAARNEEANIAACLEGLARQEYPSFELIAIDDNSTDSTLDLILEAARRDPRIVPVSAPPTPEGWTGKNGALAAGIERARGAWLLFTDADARHHPLALASAIAHAEGAGLDILSLLPRAILGGLAEKILQPAAMGFLGLWFPLDRTNRPGDELAFANGQFLLFRREAYEALGGHAAVRGEYLEDVAFARLAKARGMRVQCALGKRLLAVRMYDSLPRLVRGWRRIYLHAFRRRTGVLLGRAAEVAWLSSLPAGLLPACACLVLASGRLGFGEALALAGPAIASGFSILFAGKSRSAVGVPLVSSLLHPLAALVIAGILLDAARLAFTGAPTRWR